MKVQLEKGLKKIMVSPLEVDFLTDHGWKQSVAAKASTAKKTTKPAEGEK